MSTDRSEHHAWLHHHIWQDSPHLGHHAWLTLRQRLRTHAVVLDRLPRLWRHPLLGYLVAMLAQLAAVGLTLHLAKERQQREKVETAVRMRDDILTLATHDLRSPATSVLSRAQLVQHRLRRGPVLDAAWLDAHMQAIGDAIARLNATIDEISDVARLQVGQALDLQLEDLDVRAVVRAVAAEYNAVAKAPRVAVQTPAAAVLVCGDRVRLLRVLHNLIGNAVKYSPQGTPVDVDVQTQEQQAVITVRDQGVGIPADELPHIFTRFFRASTALSVQGTGIGLAGSRAIIEQHHGHITVESAVGQGTTVTVCLPRSADESNRAGVAVTSAPAPTRTLPG
jgi:signal transduction histidine kinase